MMEWVSVKDRLPEEDENEYILFTDRQSVFFGRYYYRNCHKKECLWKPENGYIHQSSEITHWMPLPKPPEK